MFHSTALCWVLLAELTRQLEEGQAEHFHEVVEVDVTVALGVNLANHVKHILLGVVSVLQVS